MMANGAITVLRIFGFFIDHIVGVLVVTILSALWLVGNGARFVWRRINFQTRS